MRGRKTVVHTCDEAALFVQAKRTNIGIAMITNPRVLFLDEPTSGLDSYTAHEVRRPSGQAYSRLSLTLSAGNAEKHLVRAVAACTPRCVWQGVMSLWSRVRHSCEAEPGGPARTR